LVKWAVLKHPPSVRELIVGMRHVAAEKWAWQEKAVRTWLDEHGK
jgi:hypothetical protein